MSLEPTNSTPQGAMERNGVNVLLVGENEQGCWHLMRRFEQRGCQCWFANGSDEVRSLLAARPFRLVVSTRPVSQANPLMNLLRGSDCSLFYSYPIEDSCLWLQPIRDGQLCLNAPSLRPSEFMGLLDKLVTELRESVCA